MTNRRWRSVRLLQAALLCSMTMGPLVVGKLCLPLSWYAFRCWEVLRDYRPACPAHGPFYPNAMLTKVEVGELGAHSRYAVKKPVEWRTDARGFRNRPQPAGVRPALVLIGESEVVGTSLTQADTLAEQLSVQSRQLVYAYAPATLRAFLEDRSFSEAPPAVVIVTSVEYRLAHLEPLQPPGSASGTFGADQAADSWLCRLTWEPASIWLDQVRKKPLLNRYLDQRVRQQLDGRPRHALVDERSGMLFLPEAVEVSRQHQAHLDGVVRSLAARMSDYRDALAGRGIRFIFVPVPNKETIYWDRLPEAVTNGLDRPQVLSRLVRLLRERSVEVVDLEPAFQQLRATRAGLLYHLDDTHWNAQGVALTARLIAEALAG